MGCLESREEREVTSSQAVVTTTLGRRRREALLLGTPGCNVTSRLAAALRSRGVTVRCPTCPTALDARRAISYYVREARECSLLVTAVLLPTSELDKLAQSDVWEPLVQCRVLADTLKLFFMHGDAENCELSHQVETLQVFNCRIDHSGLGMNFYEALCSVLEDENEQDVLCMLSRTLALSTHAHKVVSFLHTSVAFPSVNKDCFAPSRETLHQHGGVHKIPSLTQENLARANPSERYLIERRRALLCHASEHVAWSRRFKSSLKQLHFEVHTNELRGANLVPLMTDVAESRSDDTMLVLVLCTLREGPGGYHLVAGRQEFPLSRAWRQFCCKAPGKPKLVFFLDPCGQILSTKIAGSRSAQRDEQPPDCLLVYGFSPGFLESLCRELIQGAGQEILQLVTRAMAGSGEPSVLAPQVRLSHFISSLRRDLVFPYLTHDSASDSDTTTIVPPESTPELGTTPGRITFTLLGRDDEREAAREQLSSGVRAHLIDIAITGPRGAGKSELARRIALDVQANFQHVVWLSAESPIALDAAFTELAAQLSLPRDDDTDVRLVVERVYAALSSQRCLFVFDHVLDFEAVQHYLPFSRVLDRSSLHFMVTSEHRRWRCNLALPLECLLPAAAEELVAEAAGRAHVLANMLGYSPLALHLAACYMQHHINHSARRSLRFHADELLSRLGHTRRSLPQLGKVVEGYASFSTPLVAMWLVNMESVSGSPQGPLAIRLMDMLAFTAPCPVPLSMLAPLKVEVGENELEAALQLLSDHGSIRVDGEQIWQHRAVQDVTRKHVLRRSLVLQDLLGVLARHRDVSKHVLHVTRAWSFACKYEQLIHEFASVSLAVLRCKALSAHSRVSFIEMHRSSMLAALGWENERLLEILGEYVELLWCCDLCDQLLQECEHVIENVPQHLQNSRPVLSVQYAQARALHRLGRVDEAWMMHKLVFTARSSALGPYDPDTTRTLGGMCAAAAELAAGDDAVPLATCMQLLQTHAADQRVPLEPTLVRLANIAWRLSWDFRWDEGLQLFDEVQVALIKQLGDSHPRTLQVLLSKAEILHCMGRDDNSWLLVHTVIHLRGNIPPEKPVTREALRSLISGLESEVRRDEESLRERELGTDM